MFYIGWTSIKNIISGYKGTVKSLLYESVWKEEINNSPELFKTVILTRHDSKKEAMEKEYLFLKKFNVHKNPMYINMGIAGKHFYFDRTGIKFSEETLEKFRARTFSHTESTKKKISEGHKGKILSEKTKKLIGSYHKGKIESVETKQKKSLSHLGKKHDIETLQKMSNSSKKSVITTINEIKFPSRKAACLHFFPNLPYKKALWQLKKIL